MPGKDRLHGNHASMIAGEIFMFQAQSVFPMQSVFTLSVEGKKAKIAALRFCRHPVRNIFAHANLLQFLYMEIVLLDEMKIMFMRCIIDFHKFHFPEWFFNFSVGTQIQELTIYKAFTVTGNNSI